MRSKNILFIAYYFDPYEVVGVKRISYWANQIKSVSKGRYNPAIITSTYEDTTSSNITRIKSPLSNSFFWSIKIIPTLIKSLSDKSIIVITGGPFGTFWLTYLFRLFNKKVILDFRDPYANNPIHKINFFKKTFKNIYEFLVCLPANKIITINNECSKLINCNYNKIELIENGFDERVLKEINRKNIVEKTICYSGKISQGRDLNEFLTKMKKSPILKKYKFLYIGPDFSKIKNKDLVRSYGLLSYKENLEIISSCEYTLLLYAGYPFESSTKLFDYIGLNKPIIVYSSNKNRQGSIPKIMESYSNSFYFESKSYKINPQQKNNDEYSRMSGLILLINLFDSF
ncbi:MAG: hypothetical protein P8K77_02785 [Polaribacter sp.]|nr:hypothetical protein [Polaribacter sp.]